MTAPAKSLKFPPTHRMKTPAEFERCYARKRSASDGVLIVYACENALPHPRLGCSVSRKVGNAVVRNRYKRLFREGFRLSQHDLPPGVDLILIPRPGPYPTVDTVRASLVKMATQAARRLGGPPPSAPPLKAKREVVLPSPLAGEGGEPEDRVRGEPMPPEHVTPGTASLSAPSPGGEAPPPSPARGEGKDNSPPFREGLGVGSSSSSPFPGRRGPQVEPAEGSTSPGANGVCPTSGEGSS